MHEIAILAEESSVFAASHLARVMRVRLYVILPKYNDILDGGVKGIYWTTNTVIKEKDIIVIGYAALKKISADIERFNSIAFIASESTICRERKWVNLFLTKNNIVTYAMPDMMPFLEVKAIPAYQTMVMNNIPRIKNGGITISHSPRNGEKSKVKGTEHISRVIKELKMRNLFNYLLIKNYPHRECLKIKALSNIFIDQVICGNPDIPQQRWGGQIRYEGGLGKSGIEAMLLGCCVVTGGISPDTSDYFPPPPIVWTNYSKLYNDLDILITDIKRTKETAIRQKEWAEKYLNAEFVSRHITRHLWEK